MPAIRALTVAVGEWYARTLEICLVRNMRHFVECLVITAPEDEAVKRVALSVPGVRLYETNDFYAYGAHFNKGLCIEKGFDVLGRDGWLAVIDSDILLPDSLPLELLQPGRLYGANRRILENPGHWHPGFDWRHAAPTVDGGPVGFFQLFHAEDPHVRDKRPLYDVSFSHAGGGDAYFMAHWPKPRHQVLPVEVLHLGPRDKHWFGTTPGAVDTMDAFVIRNGWTRAAGKADRAALGRVGEIRDRVEVPGYAPTNFELPFVQRQRERSAGSTTQR